MTPNLILLMVLYSIGLACGQVLFKLAALKSSQAAGGSGLFAYLNPFLLCGLVLYGSLTLFWVWLLKSVPLSKAYPFVALSFVFTPLFSRVVLGESLGANYFIGLALIAAGVVVIVRP